MKYSEYPQYKDSGVAWLGEVPGHWDVTRLKTSATYKVSSVDKLIKDDELPVRLCNYTDVYYHDRITPNMDLMEATASVEEISRFRLKVNDVVITKDSEDWRDIARPTLIEETSPDLVCGYHLAIVTPEPRNLNGKYLLRLFQSCAVNQQFQIAASGVTRYGLPKSAIGESILPLPPISEQTAIADFLDSETGRIDTLVAKKHKLVALLKEKRSALISRTVTRGLSADAVREYGLSTGNASVHEAPANYGRGDFNRPQAGANQFAPTSKRASSQAFKDSGAGWLGEIPTNWKLKRLSYIASLKSGESITSEQIAEGGDFPVFGGNGLRGYYSSYTHDGFFVLIGRQGALCGNINYASGKFWATEHAVVVNPLEDFETKWLGELLRAMDLNQYSVSAAQPGLSVSQIGALKIPVPPLSEQTAIAAYLDRETAKIDRLVEKVETAITRLQEYRSALITAAVTGKIDVREAR